MNVHLLIVYTENRVFLGICFHSCKVDLGWIFSFDTEEPSKKCFVSSSCVKANGSLIPSAGLVVKRYWWAETGTRVHGDPLLLSQGPVLFPVF